MTGRARSLDFSEPAPILERTDNRAIRETILNLTQSEAKKRGIGKSALHYLRKNTCKDETTIYKPVMSKLFTSHHKPADITKSGIEGSESAVKEKAEMKATPVGFGALSETPSFQTSLTGEGSMSYQCILFMSSAAPRTHE